ncbi:hypothetical protein CV102_10230 [Natronococcus pandeyae]|uniref:C2H2-type domain-containing protein n=1 Tax=Natronococcus pandeyae TaxID=2055836 RepID=A0A8J8Q1V8_9EURY|nr:hypothetical protein [Natronococcus pandeyae]TYL38876.1 hypothetical protein CV102_10230 [Natronococcus pandeyae]
MTKTCPYCSTSVAEDEYVTHLERAHSDELHGLDRRLVDERKRASAPRNFKPYVLGIAVLVLFAVAYLAIFVTPAPVANAAVQQPATDAQTHIHGDIVVQYDDTVVDFDDVQYIEQDGCFHFHAHDNAEMWHVHCENVTLEYAMMTLGMDVSEDTLVVDGERFTTDDDGTTVSVTVDGEPVDPEQYVLQDGDDVRIVVETDE